MSGEKPPLARRRSPSSWIWLQGLASGALLTLATPLALLLGALLLPGLAMLLIDRHPGKPVARAMLLAGAAACHGPVQALWAAGFSLANALDVLADVSALGGAWAAAALAWLAAELAPLLAGLLAEFSWRQRDRALARRRAELEAEWGLPPAEAGFAPEGDGPPEGSGQGTARRPSSAGHLNRAAREGEGLSRAPEAEEARPLPQSSAAKGHAAGPAASPNAALAGVRQAEMR
jgi:hypothetical protein